MLQSVEEEQEVQLDKQQEQNINISTLQQQVQWLDDQQQQQQQHRERLQAQQQQQQAAKLMAAAGVPFTFSEPVGVAPSQALEEEQQHQPQAVRVVAAAGVAESTLAVASAFPFPFLPETECMMPSSTGAERQTDDMDASAANDRYSSDSAASSCVGEQQQRIPQLPFELPESASMKPSTECEVSSEQHQVAKNGAPPSKRQGCTSLIPQVLSFENLQTEYMRCWC